MSCPTSNATTTNTNTYKQCLYNGSYITVLSTVACPTSNTNTSTSTNQTKNCVVGGVSIAVAYTTDCPTNNTNNSGTTTTSTTNTNDVDNISSITCMYNGMSITTDSRFNCNNGSYTIKNADKLSSFFPAMNYQSTKRFVGWYKDSSFNNFYDVYNSLNSNTSNTNLVLYPKYVSTCPYGQRKMENGYDYCWTFNGYNSSEVRTDEPFLETLDIRTGGDIQIGQYYRFPLKYFLTDTEVRSLYKNISSDNNLNSFARFGNNPFYLVNQETGAEYSLYSAMFCGTLKEPYFDFKCVDKDSIDYNSTNFSQTDYKVYFGITEDIPAGIYKFKTAFPGKQIQYSSGTFNLTGVNYTDGRGYSTSNFALPKIDVKVNNTTQKVCSYQGFNLVVSKSSNCPTVNPKDMDPQINNGNYRFCYNGELRINCPSTDLYKDLFLPSVITSLDLSKNSNGVYVYNKDSKILKINGSGLYWFNNYSNMDVKIDGKLVNIDTPVLYLTEAQRSVFNGGIDHSYHKYITIAMPLVDMFATTNAYITPGEHTLSIRGSNEIQFIVE